MGKPPPNEWPTLDPNLWYQVTVDCFGPSIPPFGCRGALVQTGTGCLPGHSITEWVRLFHECSPTPLLHQFGGTCQRITNVVGPYDTDEACVLDL